MKPLFCEYDIIRFQEVLEQYNKDLIQELKDKYVKGYCYTHIHIDIDLLDNEITTDITRSLYNAQHS